MIEDLMHQWWMLPLICCVIVVLTAYVLSEAESKG